ncbi:M10 family metallopeptidase C-terminal domain-containing protein [Pseudonocardia sp. TMWB2A]|uniref:M10 family metallopeptidase C-terminal domain-containing protein n=1 Tax=Pseudonocardia sp. TMWB2A TaxID=687430 RepID=UPI00307E729F
MAKKQAIFDYDGEIYYHRPDQYGAHELSEPLNHEPVEFNLDDYAGLGFTYRGKPIADLDRVFDQIDSGRQLKITGNNTITYTFLDLNHLTGLYNNPNNGFTAGNGVNPFSATQRAEARQSIQFWDDLIAPTFVEKNGMGADIVMANSADPAQAYAYYPGTKGWKFQSDVFIADPNLNWTNNWLGFNGYGATTLIHELGHAIGLSHPGAYNGAAATTYAGQAEYAQDSEQYTIMSYWSPSETGARVVDWSTFLNGNAQTPMLHDIYVIQQKYGADLTTRTGDTVYGFNSNAGRDVFDFSSNKFPNVAVYDAGGNDTFDFSGFNASTFIDLHAGSFSSAAQAVPTLAEINANRAALTQIADGAQTFGALTQASVDATANSYMNAIANAIAADTGVTGVRATAYDNIAIAYGTIIENAIGGSARDVIWGNEVANKLDGRGGDDVLNGFEGADTLTGGTGKDIFQFSHAEFGDRITDFVSGTDKIDLSAFAGTLSFVGDAAFSGANQVRYANGTVYADFNGDGVADFSVHLGAGTALLAGDLIL